MATMTMEPMIKTAMGKIGLEEKTSDLLEALDEIWLDTRLKISMEQADRGETMSMEEMRRELAERKARNGYYSIRR